MKKVLVIAMALVMVFSAAVMAKSTVKINVAKSSAAYPGSEGLGIGLVFGSDNGLVLKTWLDKTSALQFDFSYGIWHGIGVGAAYLIHNYDIIEASGIKLPLYFGIKAFVSFYTYSVSSSGAAFGVQVPLGLDIILKGTPIDVYIEFDPGIGILPGYGFGPAFGGGIGVRYWLD